MGAFSRMSQSRCEEGIQVRSYSLILVNVAILKMVVMQTLYFVSAMGMPDE